MAAAFGAVSPLLIWYAQEARMYAFVTLFGLLALLTQLRAIRDGSGGQLGALHPRHGRPAVVPLLRPAPDRGAAADLRGRAHPAAARRRARRGRCSSASRYSPAVLAIQLVPLLAFAQKQFDSTGAALGSPSGTYDDLSFYAVVSNMAWALWGYHPDGITELLAAMWPLFLLLSLLLLGRGGSRQTMILAAAAHRTDRAPAVRGALRPRAVRGALLPGRRAAAVAARGPARDRVDTKAGRRARSPPAS